MSTVLWAAGNWKLPRGPCNDRARGKLVLRSIWTTWGLMSQEWQLAYTVGPVVHKTQSLPYFVAIQTYSLADAQSSLLFLRSMFVQPIWNHWRRCWSRGTNPPIYIESRTAVFIQNHTECITKLVERWSTHGGRAFISSWAATRQSQWFKSVAGLGTVGLLCGAWDRPINFYSLYATVEIPGNDLLHFLLPC